MIRVVGLDVSLSSTGIARLSLEQGKAPRSFSTTVGRSLDEGATLEQRCARLEWVKAAVLDEVIVSGTSWPLDLVVVEGPAPAMGARPGADEMAALRWALLAALHALRVPLAVVSPPTLKVYAAGHGGSAKTPVTKAHVVAAARRHYAGLFDLAAGPGVADRADSAVLAAMGARHLGRPIDELPSTHTRALKSVRWPAPPITREDPSQP